MLRFLDAGESHGPAQIAVLEGMPSGLELSSEDIQKELEKRRGGSGRGGRGQIEKDQVKILSGVRLGKTLGSPIGLLIENLDFPNWPKEVPPQTTPRPGHADLIGVQKYHFGDIRNVLERASARETVMRVAVGAIAKKLLSEFGIYVGSHTTQIGSIKSEKRPISFAENQKIFAASPQIRCLDKKKSEQMQNAILTATKNKETLGGTVETIAYNVPPGLGSYVHFDRKLDGQLAQHLMSIQSVKAVEIGSGIKSAGQYGSAVHDEIFYGRNNFFRRTNRCGGIEGGVSNGENLILRVYLKPISTLGNPLKTADIITKKQARALIERSDICVVPRAGAVIEAAVAFVLAGNFLEKFGGDSLIEVKRNFEGYKKQLTTI